MILCLYKICNKPRMNHQHLCKAKQSSKRNHNQVLHQIDLRTISWVTNTSAGVPYRWDKRYLVSLYNIGQSSPHDIAFGVELGPRSIFIMVSKSGPSQFIVSDVMPPPPPILQLFYAVCLCNTFIMRGWSARSKSDKLLVCASTPLSRIFHKFKQNKQTVTSSRWDKTHPRTFFSHYMKNMTL